MSRLFRSFSFAFFPEEPSTIGIRVTWNKHQKLVRSPHSSRTSFSHWMQKLATSLSPHNFTTSPHRTMFSLLGGISGNFWSEKTHFKKSNHWVTAVLSSTKSLNMPTCQHARRCFARTSPNFKNGQAFLFARIFPGWNTDVGISHGISVNFLPVTWETSPPQKKNQRRKHWPFEWTFCDLVDLRVGQWPPAEAAMHQKSHPLVDAMVSYQKNILETTTSSADEGPSCHQSGL